MLKLFEVENFKNFKDKIIIDFADTREYKFNTQCIKDGMLKNIIIYGKNSVGKTNLGYALFDITTHLGYKNRDHIQYHNYINCFKFLFINQIIPFTEETYYKAITTAAKCNNYEIIKILIEKLTDFDEGYIKTICKKCIQKGLFETIDILMNHSEKFKKKYY